jgi:spore cortex formation protein SpoVR/YcgB (stage V sporulation)
MSAPVKSTQDALALLAKHDPSGLYDRLEPWQQRELLCIIRRVCNEAAAMQSRPRK